MSKKDRYVDQYEDDLKAEQTLYKRHANLPTIAFFQERVKAETEKLDRWYQEHPTEAELFRTNEELRWLMADDSERNRSEDRRKQINKAFRIKSKLQEKADNDLLAKGINLRTQNRIEETRLKSAKDLYMKKKWNL